MTFRTATINDLEAIIQLLHADDLGIQRERIEYPIDELYVQAFNKIIEDENQQLLVVENDEQKIIGTMQLSWLQYLTYQGGLRLQIEAVRVSQSQRGRGIGKTMMDYVIKLARIHNAHMIQLTTDASREESVRFYKSCGFNPSHIGMKWHLNN